MRAEQCPGPLVEDHLDETLVLAQRDRLAVAYERKAADADIELVLLRRLLGKADGGDLRRAIGAARDETLVHGMWLEALDRLDADDALVLGLVRQQRRTGNVADGVNPGHIGAIERVDHDGAAVGLHAELFKTEMFDVAGDADRGDDSLDGERLRTALAILDSRSDAVRPLVELRHLRAGRARDRALS